MTSSPISSSASIVDRRGQIHRKMDRACRLAGRDSTCVTLTAVSKTQPECLIEAALAAGQRVFGENRVQEATVRWTPHRRALSGLELRLIGPLQSNKATEAVALFDVIETLDREKLVHALVDAANRLGRPAPRVLIQVNTGLEPQKAGVAPPDLPRLIAVARDSGLNVVGLMAIPPVDQAPGPHFALLDRLAERHGLLELSMGMSGDFETAIRFGATHVRLGTALFGRRA
jgi:pyridoxal phosphate enzyme, YggS family